MSYIMTRSVTWPVYTVVLPFPSPIVSFLLLYVPELRTTATHLYLSLCDRWRQSPDGPSRCHLLRSFFFCSDCQLIGTSADP